MKTSCWGWRDYCNGKELLRWGGAAVMGVGGAVAVQRSHCHRVELSVPLAAGGPDRKSLSLWGNVHRCRQGS